MKTYVYHYRQPLDVYVGHVGHGGDGGAQAGIPAVHGFYVYINNDNNETVDIAGPFDDELDAEMARRRIEECAA